MGGGSRFRSQKKGQMTPTNFIFVIGGISRSEIRACYHTNRHTNSANIVLGSDCVQSANDFVRHLCANSVTNGEALDRKAFCSFAGLPAPSDNDLVFENLLNGIEEAVAEDVPDPNLPATDVGSGGDGGC